MNDWNDAKFAAAHDAATRLVTAVEETEALAKELPSGPLVSTLPPDCVFVAYAYLALERRQQEGR